MNISVSVEKASNISRKLTIKVPADIVAARFEKGLQEVARTAKIKGFRPGMVPLPMVKKFYGEDVRHNVFHKLIDESYAVALRQEKIQAIGQPQIDTPESKAAAKPGHEGHDHDDHSGHILDETKELTFTATVEVMPEIDVKSYTGLSVSRGSDAISTADHEKNMNDMLASQASLEPTADDYGAAKADFVDLEFKGGLITDKGIEERAGMSGQRMIEIGSDQLIEGFEDNLIGMKKGEKKTFKVPFPADYFEKDLAGKMSEFSVTVHEVKKKSLPALDDELAKQLGFESVEDLKSKSKANLETEKKGEVERKFRSDLLAQLIEKNTFDVPQSMIQAQTRALAQDVASNLKNQGFNDAMIQEALMSEMQNLKVRAENQVRASLILEAISKKEKLDVSSTDVDAEITQMAKNMNVDETKIREFYLANPRRREDLEFRVREEKTMKFLTEKSKIKQEK
ncbi:MAG: trigger factor [Cryobacterium sp.]|nr:trigger factor [Oligoflexia bacterium]